MPFTVKVTNVLYCFANKFEWLITKQCFGLLKKNDLFQILLKALLLRMRRTLDDDVFMPLYPKT